MAAIAMARSQTSCSLDEPTSALDPEMVGDALNVMKDLAKQGMTMIISYPRDGICPSSQSKSSLLLMWEFLEDGKPDQTFDDPQHPRLKEFW